MPQKGYCKRHYKHSYKTSLCKITSQVKSQIVFWSGINSKFEDQKPFTSKRL